MIIVKLKGGLGNQMFQYAFARYLSMKNDDVLKLDIQGLEETSHKTKRTYKLDVFNIEAELANNKEIYKIKYPYGIFSKAIRFIKHRIFKIFYVKFYPSLLNIKGDVYLDGYYQSEKYFIEIKDVIFNDFILRNPLSNQAGYFSEKIQQTANTISLHIRRGDYVNDPKTKKNHDVCDIAYYQKAVEIFMKKNNNPTFFVFSDDMNWVKENLKLNNAFYVSNEHPNSDMKDYEEMILMSQCNHNIIANSSFSWWGAWLNNNYDKIVIAPKQWTVKKTSDQLNILPETWTQI